MSKKFRARTVDVNRKMQIFLSDEITDLAENTPTKRIVPKVPTGMEKEEERELHFQKAISAQQRFTTGNAEETDSAAIPVPKVTADVSYYDKLYPPNYKLTKQLIKVRTLNDLDTEPPDYDLDSEDESWLNSAALGISALQFEEIMDVLEKRCESRVLKPDEIRTYLPDIDEGILLTVYDHWLQKRINATTQGRKLLPRVKVEKEGVNSEDPYLAFRKRSDKIQTRKNRRNDEESYEKLLKLRSDLQKAVTLAEMVESRERKKRDLVKVSIDVVEKRFLMQEIDSDPLSRLFGSLVEKAKTTLDQGSENISTSPTKSALGLELGVMSVQSQNTETKDKAESQNANPYTFVRKSGCKYYQPKESKSIEIEDSWDHQSKFKPTCLNSTDSTISSSSSSLQFVGLTRRRIGRGGRMIFDRYSQSRNSESDHDHEEPTQKICDTYYRPVLFDDDDDDEPRSDQSALLMGPTGVQTVIDFEIGTLELEKDEPGEIAPTTTDQSQEIETIMAENENCESSISADSSWAQIVQKEWHKREWWRARNLSLNGSGSTIDLDREESIAKEEHLSKMDRSMDLFAPLTSPLLPMPNGETTSLVKSRKTKTPTTTRVKKQKEPMGKGVRIGARVKTAQRFTLEGPLTRLERVTTPTPMPPMEMRPGVTRISNIARAVSRGNFSSTPLIPLTALDRSSYFSTSFGPLGPANTKKSQEKKPSVLVNWTHPLPTPSPSPSAVGEFDINDFFQNHPGPMPVSPTSFLIEPVTSSGQFGEKSSGRRI